MTKPLLPAFACALLATAIPAEAQDLPEGPGKLMVTTVCGGLSRHQTVSRSDTRPEGLAQP